MPWPFRKSSFRKIQNWLWILLLIGLWELIRISAGVNPLIMPSFGVILGTLIRGIIRGELLGRWILSLGVVCSGLLAGAGIAVILTMLSGAAKSAESFLSLLSSLMHPLPGLALMPLVILWFGIGYSAVFFVMLHAVIWPVYVNLESGRRSLAPAWSLYARNLGLNGCRKFFRIILPGSFPHLISGIRTGWARSWRAFIAAEMVFGAVGSRGGLGWQLFEGRVMMDTPALYSALLAVMMTGMAVEDLILGRWESTVRKKWGEESS